MLGHYLVNCKKLFENAPKMVQVQGIRSVRFGMGRIVVDLEKDTVHSGCHRSPGEHRNEFRLSSGDPVGCRRRLH